jgi:hypothetical protein
VGLALARSEDVRIGNEKECDADDSSLACASSPRSRDDVRQVEIATILNCTVVTASSSMSRE